MDTNRANETPISSKPTSIQFFTSKTINHSAFSYQQIRTQIELKLLFCVNKFFASNAADWSHLCEHAALVRVR
jgi:hypothetical protein